MFYILMKISAVNNVFLAYSKVNSVKNNNNKINVAASNYASMPSLLSESGFYTSGVVFGKSSSVIDKNDEFYSNTSKFSEYLSEKIDKTLLTTSPNDVGVIVSNVIKNTGCDEKTVREVIARLVQFTSTKSLSVIEDKLNADNVESIMRMRANLSINDFLEYISYDKKQIKCNGNSAKALFLDDEILNKYIRLKEISHPRIDKAYSREKNELYFNRVRLYILDGLGSYSGSNLGQFSMFGQSTDIETLASSVINSMKEQGKTFDELTNVPAIKQAKKYMGRHHHISVIKNPLTDNPTNENISEMLNPPKPSKEDIQAFIEYYAENLSRQDAFQYSKKEIKTVIAKYLDNILTCYSPQALNQALKNKYSQIKEEVEKLGKTMDDVVYYIPTLENIKSFNLITKQFATVNNIPKDKIILFQPNCIPGKFYKDKVLVVLDDFVGSGESIVDTKFDYHEFTMDNKDTNVIFAPVVCLQGGYNYINSAIRIKKRLDKDRILTTNLVNYSDFKDNILTPEERAIMSAAIGSEGYSNSKACSVFPFSIPDNNTNLSFIFGAFFLKNMYSPDKIHTGRNYSKPFDEICNEIKMRSRALSNN